MTRGSIARLVRPLVLVAAIPVFVGFAPTQVAVASSGPSMVKNINPSGGSDPSSLTKVGTVLYFAANDGIHGRELWKSDGTSTGTKMVRDLRAGSRGSFPGDLINVKGTLYFTANDGAHGRELWRSNGTSTGTKMVRDLTSDPLAGTSTNVYLPVAVGSRLFFFVADCCAGGSSLVVTDGTSAGTHRIQRPLEDVSSARSLGDRLFFVQADYGVDPTAQRLWVSNGTTTGTHAFAPAPGASQVSILPASGNFLYFATSDGQLWRTDGTAAGTIALTAAGQVTSLPSDAVYLNHAIYFMTDDGLWRTDGTAVGTGLIKSGTFYELVAAGGNVYFGGPDLWRSDGTAAGTKLVGSFDDAMNFTAVGSYVCFAGENPFQDEWRLWASSGSAAGTHQVRSWPGHDAMSARAVVASRLYFAANDGSHGSELWKYAP